MNIQFDMLFFLMIRRPPRSTLDRSSAASDVYKRQVWAGLTALLRDKFNANEILVSLMLVYVAVQVLGLSLIHISEPTRPY